MSTLLDMSFNQSTGIAKMELNNPPVNSLSSKMMENIIDQIKELKVQKGLRGLLISSQQPNIFTGGLNLAETTRTDETTFRKFYYLFQEMNYQLYKAPFLTAIAINGHAPAGGCVMALTTDYRVMVNNPEKPYRIGLNETSIGMVAPVWVQQLLIDVIGKRQAVQAVLSSTLFTTEEAFTMGLIDEMADSTQEAQDKAESYLNMYREMPISAIVETKQLARKEFIQKFEAQREFDLINFTRMALAPAAQDIIGQFLNRKK